MSRLLLVDLREGVDTATGQATHATDRITAKLDIKLLYSCTLPLLITGVGEQASAQSPFLDNFSMFSENNSIVST